MIKAFIATTEQYSYGMIQLWNAAEIVTPTPFPFPTRKKKERRRRELSMLHDRCMDWYTHTHTPFFSDKSKAFHPLSVCLLLPLPLFVQITQFTAQIPSNGGLTPPLSPAMVWKPQLLWPAQARHSSVSIPIPRFHTRVLCPKSYSGCPCIHKERQSWESELPVESIGFFFDFCELQWYSPNLRLWPDHHRSRCRWPWCCPSCRGEGRWGGVLFLFSLPHHFLLFSVWFSLP